MSTEQRRISLIGDTDMHGGLSLAASWLALKRAGLEPAVAYSNFQMVPRGQSPTEPVTNAQWLADSLPHIVAPGRAGELYILDIPINSLAPQKHIDTLRQYVAAGDRVTVVNKFGHEDQRFIKLYMDAGVEFVPTESDIAVALYIPRKLGIVDSEIERIARWAALSDFDPAVEREVTEEEEYLVTEIVDQYWKFQSKQDPVIPQQYRAMHGNVGALARMVIEHGLEWLEQRARETVKELPMPDYEVKGDVVIVRGPDIPGQMWKLVAKACRLTRAKVGVAKATSPRGIAVIIAANWRWRAKLPQLSDIIDRTAEEVAAGRSVVGNPGARSILARSPEDADMLIQQAVEKLNQHIQSQAYTPKTAHLINERYVAEAIVQDFRMLAQTLTQILQQQQKMYQEYLDLKRKQVELLERLQRREAAD